MSYIILILCLVIIYLMLDKPEPEIIKIYHDSTPHVNTKYYHERRPRPPIIKKIIHHPR